MMLQKIYNFLMLTFVYVYDDNNDDDDNDGSNHNNNETKKSNKIYTYISHRASKAKTVP
jgi:hypothetical protein